MDFDEVLNTEMNSVHRILSEGNIEEIRELRERKVFASLLKSSGSEIIGNVSLFLENKQIYKRPEIIKCYEELLKLIVDETEPQNSFITLLEQLDEDNCCLEKFLFLLKPLKLCLFKLSTSRGCWLEWALSTIKCYLDGLPSPEDHQIELDEKKILTKGRYLDSILTAVEALFDFYESFIDNSNSPEEVNALIVFGFQLLTQPAAYVYVEKFDELQQTCKKIVGYMNQLSCHAHCLLDHVNERDMTSTLNNYSRLNLDEETNVTEENHSRVSGIEDKITILNLAVYYYFVITENHFGTFPCVYDRLYLFHKLFVLSVVLLQHTHNAVIGKGLLLSHRLLWAIEDGSISRHFLELKVHAEFVKMISKISVYSYIFENRKVAVQLLQTYIRKFDVSGTYALYLHITTVTNSADVDSEIITLFRKHMHTSFVVNKLRYYQKSKLLIDLLKVFCRLDDEHEIDVIEYKNKVISVSYLFALILRRDVNNETTLVDHFDYFERNYFSMIKVAVKKSRETFQREINEDTSSGETKIDHELFNVFVDGCKLPALKQEQKINATRNALTALGLIEHALELVYEYANKSHLYTS